MDRLLLALGAISAGVAVAAGAFGAQGLRARVSPEMLAVFETGARYQMYHALALVAAAWVAGRWPGAAAAWAGGGASAPGAGEVSGVGGFNPCSSRAATSVAV